MITKAKEFAALAHEGDFYGTYPYTKHLHDVYCILSSFGISDRRALTVASLHDTIEDTSVVYEDILEIFGEEIADLVFLLTDKRGRNRLERHAATYTLIAEVHLARLVKIADRIANVTMTIRDSEKKFAMYKKEHKFFRETMLSGIKEGDEFFAHEARMMVHLDGLIEFGIYAGAL